MRTDTIIIFAIILVLIIFDFTHEVNKGLFHIIFLTAMVIYETIIFIRLNNKVKNNKKNAFKFRNPQWFIGLVSWIVMAFLFLSKHPIDAYFVIKSFLLCVLFMIFIKREIEDIYIIKGNKIENIRTSNIIKLSENTDTQIFENSVKFSTSKGSISLERAKIIDNNFEDFKLLIEKVINNKA